MLVIDMVANKRESQESSDAVSDESLDQRVRWIFFYSPCVGPPWSVAVADCPTARIQTQPEQ